MEKIGEDNIYFDDIEQRTQGVPCRMGTGAARVEAAARIQDALQRADEGLAMRLSALHWTAQAVGARRQCVAGIDLEFARQMYDHCPPYPGSL